MTHPQMELKTLLAPFRRRMRLQAAIRGGTLGLLAGCFAGLAMRSTPILSLAISVVLPLLGALLFALQRLPWDRVAAVADESGGLQDSALSAWELANLESPYRTLQHSDAVAKLQAVPVKQALPLCWPRLAPLGLIGFLAMLAIVLPPLVTPGPAVQAADDAVLAEADRLDELADHLLMLAEAEQLDELKPLAAEMKATAAELRKPGTEAKDAIAKIADLQKRFKEAMAKLNQDEKATQVDAAMKEIAKALESSEAYQKAADSLKKGDYKQAVKDLDDAAKKAMNPEQAKALSKKLAEVAAKLKSQGLERLGTAAEKAGASMPKSPLEREDGQKDMKKNIQEQQRRKRILEIMAQEQKKIDECKSRCQARNLIQNPPNPNGQPKPGENGKSKNDPKGNAGKRGGIDGNANPKADKQDGDPLSPDKGKSLNPEDREPGDKGDGDGKRDGSGDIGPRKLPALTPEDLAQSKKLANEAMDRDQVPLGHRQAIRRFFELLTAPQQKP